MFYRYLTIIICGCDVSACEFKLFHHVVYHQSDSNDHRGEASLGLCVDLGGPVLNQQLFITKKIAEYFVKIMD